MLPTLKPGRIVLATGWFKPKSLKVNEIIIVLHNNTDKMKRIKKIDGQMIYIVGDNPNQSTDSRHFGWLPLTSVQAKVLGLSQVSVSKDK